LFSELRDRPGTDDITTVTEQHRLRWYRQKDENDWVKKTHDYEVVMKVQDVEAAKENLE